MASLIRMSCEILKIIQINEIDEQIRTLSHAFHFPLSSLRFLNTEISRKFERNLLTATVFVGKKFNSAQERAVSAQTLNSLIKVN